MMKVRTNKLVHRPVKKGKMGLFKAKQQVGRFSFEKHRLMNVEHDQIKEEDEEDCSDSSDTTEQFRAEIEKAEEQIEILNWTPKT